MGVLASIDDIAFHSNIPVAADITVAIVYAVFGKKALFKKDSLTPPVSHL